MQTIKGRLEQIQSFLIEKIEKEKIRLPQAPEEGMAGEKTDLVAPIVAVGNIPHANFNIMNARREFFNAPYVLVGMKEASFDYDEERLPILIQVCCYTVENYRDSNVPDNMGMLDALNLLEKIKNWINQDAPFPVEKPYSIGTYDTFETTYPYAFGYIGFTITTNEGTVNRKKFNY